RRAEYDMGFFFDLDFIGAGFDGGFEHRIFVRHGDGVADFSDLIPAERDGVGFAEIAAVLRERGADFTGGWGAIFGHALHDDADAAGAETFVADFFQLLPARA